MNLKWASVFLAMASGSMALLPFNHLCGDSKDCDANCQQGRNHVLSPTNSASYFGCSLATEASDYRLVKCNPPDYYDGGRGDDSPGIIAACSAASGAPCSADCIILKEHEETFREACLAKDGRSISNVSDYMTYAEIVESACPHVQ
ncbi:uncharacterized protein BDV14DRAFT_91311 [Aspergillus stella-maris]|uniref:uncharacterized protein n=1 Tax=Aspergillus stella-maris TaxID=1810926 RepID=UPI003CCDB7EE